MAQSTVTTTTATSSTTAAVPHREVSVPEQRFGQLVCQQVEAACRLAFTRPMKDMVFERIKLLFADQIVTLRKEFKWNLLSEFDEFTSNKRRRIDDTTESDDDATTTPPNSAAVAATAIAAAAGTTVATSNSPPQYEAHTQCSAAMPLPPLPSVDALVPEPSVNARAATAVAKAVRQSKSQQQFGFSNPENLAIVREYKVYWENANHTGPGATGYVQFVSGSIGEDKAIEKVKREAKQLALFKDESKRQADCLYIKPATGRLYTNQSLAPYTVIGIVEGRYSTTASSTATATAAASSSSTSQFLFRISDRYKGGSFGTSQMLYIAPSELSNSTNLLLRDQATEARGGNVRLAVCVVYGIPVLVAFTSTAVTASSPLILVKL